MHIYLTELEEQVRRHHDPGHGPGHRSAANPPVSPRTPTRHRVAARLRQVADRLEH